MEIPPGSSAELPSAVSARHGRGQGAGHAQLRGVGGLPGGNPDGWGTGARFPYGGKRRVTPPCCCSANPALCPVDRGPLKPDFMGEPVNLLWSC